MTQSTLLLALILLGVLCVIIFNFVVFFGAPFLPTRQTRVEEALDLLELKAGQTLLELGSGDGRLLRSAAKRKIRCVGYELNPLLVLWSRLRCFRVRKYVTVRWKNYWQESLPPADGIYVFLLKPYMAKLDAKLQREAKRPLRLVSFVFPLPTKKLVREQQGLFVYDYAPRTRK